MNRAVTTLATVCVSTDYIIPAIFLHIFTFIYFPFFLNPSLLYVGACNGFNGVPFPPEDTPTS